MGAWRIKQHPKRAFLNVKKILKINKLSGSTFGLLGGCNESGLMLSNVLISSMEGEPP
jgi:hypothetical protein